MITVKGAKELFESIGFSLIDYDARTILYERNGEEFVRFNRNKKTVYCWHGAREWAESGVEMDKDLLDAIVRQMEEL